MVKFEGVTDPERARKGDLLVFPHGARRLNLSVGTLAGLGLSVGGTCRSNNSPSTVAKWLSRFNGAGRRTFLVADVDADSASARDASLLGMGAYVTSAESPRLRGGTLVPFFNGAPDPLPLKEMMSCWSHATDGSVERELAARMGRDGALRDWRELSATDVMWPPDACMTLVWNERPLIDSDDWRSRHSSTWFPTNESDDLKNAYDVTSLMSWNRFDKESRIAFNRGFLTELVRRGARLVRPDAKFMAKVTAAAADWWCGRMAQRFDARTKAGDLFRERLTAALKADRARTRAYGRHGDRADRSVHAMIGALERGLA